MNKQSLLFLLLISVFTASRAQIGINDTIVPVKIVLDTIPDSPQIRSTGSGYTENLVTSTNFAPSPEAHSLMQYSDVPVSLYTGVPNISIPIYTIEIGDYKLPITLQYHASGIKVTQEASRVGLGWSLHAGGAVGRIIQNRDDFDEYGFYMCADTVPEFYISDFYNYSNIDNAELDLESDIYHYNFADYSGKFVVRKGEYDVDDLERYFLLKPEDNLKIEGCESDFCITTEDNIRYIFDKIELRTMCCMTFEDEKEGIYYDIAFKPNRTFIPPDESSYFSRPYTKTNWLLSEIELPNGYKIYFDYDRIENSYLSPVNESYTEYKILEKQSIITTGYGSSVLDTDPKNKRNISLELTKEEYILKRIRWNSGRVEFKKSDIARKDITGYDSRVVGTSQKRVASENTALEYIEVYSKTNDIPVMSYKLHHSYFFGKEKYNGSFVVDTTYLSARLKLDSITIQGTGNAVQKYKMEYDMSDNLPLKNEYYTDKWGYYTDKNPLKIPYSPHTVEWDWHPYIKEKDYKSVNELRKDSTRTIVAKGQTFYYHDGYEATSSEAGKTWMLTKLVNPMGAETIFEYECNTINNEELDTIYTDTTSLNKYRVGGFRISKMSTPVSTTKYVYEENGNSSGHLIRKPSSTSHVDYKAVRYDYDIITELAVTYAIQFNSSPIRTPFNPYNGNHMGYSVVYTIKEEGDQELVERYRFFNKPETDYYYASDQGTHNPFNGLLENHRIFRNGEIVKEVQYQYDTISVNKVRCLKIGESNYAKCYYVTGYFTYLDSIITIDNYNQKDIKYVYDNEIYKPRRVTTYSTGLPTSKVEYYYSKDYPSYLGGKFKNNHLNTVELMERHYNDNDLIKTVVNTHHDDVLVKPHKEYLFYGISGGNVNPLTLSASDSKKPDVTYCSYTAMGRPTEIVSRGGQHVVLLWSYRNQYVVAQINNATLSDVVNCGINIDELANKQAPSDEDWEKIHNLRSSLPSASVVVSKYEPLVGMISQTDTRGVETRYTYDEFNRLHQVIEVRGNEEYILKQYEYNYATEE